MLDTEKPRPEGPFPFKVNGIEIKTELSELLARQILALAAEHHAMPGKPDEYVLQGEKGQYDQDELVDLLEDNIFITIPTTPTPVA